MPCLPYYRFVFFEALLGLGFTCGKTGLEEAAAKSAAEATACLLARMSRFQRRFT